MLWNEVISHCKVFILSISNAATLSQISFFVRVFMRRIYIARRLIQLLAAGEPYEFRLFHETVNCTFPPHRIQNTYNVIFRLFLLGECGDTIAARQCGPN